MECKMGDYPTLLLFQWFSETIKLQYFSFPFLDQNIQSQVMKWVSVIQQREDEINYLSFAAISMCGGE